MFTGRASHPPSQARSPSTLCSPVTPAARQAWGDFLRIHTLRFRPADMRVAEARSTIGWRVRRAPEPGRHRRDTGH